MNRSASVAQFGLESLSESLNGPRSLRQDRSKNPSIRSYFGQMGQCFWKNSTCAVSFHNDVQSETNFCPVPLHSLDIFPSMICQLETGPPGGQRLGHPSCAVPPWCRAALYHFPSLFLTAGA